MGMPLRRAMRQGLWDSRTELPSKHIERVALPGWGRARGAACLHQRKTQKTPDDELALALKRQKLALARKRQNELLIMSKKHHGTSLDGFPKEEGSFEEGQALVGRKVQIELV
jgi:hypothetical protein